MKTAGWVGRHRRSILFLFAAMIAAGLLSITRTPVALFPQVTFPRVVVSLDAGDRPASRMAMEVTTPVEVEVRAIQGVRSIRSTTSRGSAEISINFEWGTDMQLALLSVQSAIAQLSPQLPAGTTFLARRMDPIVFPVLGYSLTSDDHSLIELRDIALYQLRPMLTTVPGVARVGVLGGQQAELRVTVDPAKLASYGLTVADVSKAVAADNVVSAVGRLEDHDKLYLVLSQNVLDKPADIGAVSLRSGPRGLVFLRDVAVITHSTVPQWIRVTADAHDAVIFQVYQQPGGNTVQIAKDVRSLIDGMGSTLPHGVRIANWYDQSELILASARSVFDAVMVGVVLAMVILLIFLRSPKITLIAAIVVPGVLASATLLLFVLGESFNIMTLGGLAAAVGLIIDDAIVMVEQIMRRLHEPYSGDRNERIRSAALEFTRPLVGSSVSTIIIFAPLAFLSGVTGAFFKALSLTMVVALSVSFLVAWLVVPLIVRFLLRTHVERPPTAISRAVLSGYRHGARWLLAHRWGLVPALVPLLLFGWLGYRHVGSGFMPSMDEGGFVLDYRAPSGTSLSETDRLVRQVETVLRQIPEVQTYSRRTGLQLGGGLTESNEGDFFVRLRPLPRRSLDAVMDDARARLQHEVPGLQIEMAKLMEDLIGDLTAVPQPIEVKLYSDDEATLTSMGERVSAELEHVPGVVEVAIGTRVAGDALIVHVDPARAALENMAPDEIRQQLEDHLTGAFTTQVEEGPKMVGIHVWTPSDLRDTDGKVTSLLIRAPDGHLFPLGRVATVDRLVGQPQIMRDDLKRMVVVTGRISGRDMGSVIKDVRAALAKPGVVPDGIYWRLGGLYAEQQAAFTGLVMVFAAAVILVFVTLLFLYERFRHAITIMITTLLAAGGVFIGLWLSHTELNISSLMGITMIIGIVTEVAILYVSEYQDLAQEHEMREALLLAGQNRLRPVAMTTFAAILALMPLALGIGQGSAMQQPLAIAIVSGLVLQMPIVLFVLPVLLTIGHKTARE